MLTRDQGSVLAQRHYLTLGVSSRPLRDNNNNNMAGAGERFVYASLV